MSEGVIYYNKGGKHIVRMCVSIAALRDFYEGKISVLLDGDQPKWFCQYLEENECERRVIPDTNERPLVRKAQLWRYTPYDISLFFDADTLVVHPCINDLFGLIKKHEFVVHNFSGWETTGAKISKRIEQWAQVRRRRQIDVAKKYGQAVNTGVFGFSKGADILPHWESLTRLGYENGCTRRMVDELACQCLLPFYKHYMVGAEYGASVRFNVSEKPKIWHYHGNKHCIEAASCDFWKAAYWDLRNCSRFYNELGIPNGDRRLRKYLADTVRDDLTIVTAVNPRYYGCFRKNWEAWMQVEGIRQQRFIVFVNRFGRNDVRLNFLRKHRNVNIVRWKFPVAGENVRERMLSAFIFGVARYVNTDFWMKLDADASPRNGQFEWPDYHNFTLVGHKWGYTRVKGDPGCKRHWLNTLDDKFSPNNREFVDNIEPKTRHGHPRIASFCSIEKTSHTKRMAEMFGDRLPVPSQDTCSWYMAHKFGTVKRMNMKKFFTA